MHFTTFVHLFVFIKSFRGRANTGIMSDVDDFEEDSDDGDFSVSEDEWAPGKDDGSSESDFEETINDSAEPDDTILEKAKK